MTKGELANRRLVNLGIVAMPNKQDKLSPAGLSDALGDLVGGLGAVQAQDYPGTVWGLGLRLPGSTVEQVEQAVEAASIVRTWPMRGTLHFVAAADLRWMVRLLTPKVVSGTKARQISLELDATQFAKSQETMRRVLSGGQLLTREALLSAVEADGISVAGGRGYHLLFRAAMDLTIAVGPTRGKQQYFALLDDWVTPNRDRGLSGEEAVAELAWRYFASHGPAGVKDFAGWSGLTMGQAKAGLAANKSRLESFVLDGVEHWWAPAASGTSDVVKASYPKNRVHLLPGFDEYILGYKDRNPVLDPAFAERVCPGGNGVFAPTVVIDGQVRGTWKKTLRKKGMLVEASPFTKFTPDDQAGIELAAQGYAAFYGFPAGFASVELT